MIKIGAYKSKKTKSDYHILFLVIAMIGFTYEDINAFAFIVNLLIALSGLILMVIYDIYKNNNHNEDNNKTVRNLKIYDTHKNNNHSIIFMHRDSSRYYFGITLVIYMIVFIQYLRLYSGYYTYLFIFIFSFSLLYYLLFLKVKAIINRRGYKLNNELTSYYNRKFENLLGQKKIKIFTHKNKSFPHTVYTNILTAHIYINNRIWNTLDNNEKDAVILHEIGHIFDHKNQAHKFTIGILTILTIVYTLSILSYFSVELKEIFYNFTPEFIIFNVILLIILVIFLMNYKKLIKNLKNISIIISTRER